MIWRPWKEIAQLQERVARLSRDLKSAEGTIDRLTAREAEVRKRDSTAIFTLQAHLKLRGGPGATQRIWQSTDPGWIQLGVRRVRLMEYSAARGIDGRKLNPRLRATLFLGTAQIDLITLADEKWYDLPARSFMPTLDEIKLVAADPIEIVLFIDGIARAALAGKGGDDGR